MDESRIYGDDGPLGQTSFVFICLSVNIVQMKHRSPSIIIRRRTQQQNDDRTKLFSVDCPCGGAGNGVFLVIGNNCLLPFFVFLVFLVRVCIVLFCGVWRVTKAPINLSPERHHGSGRPS